MNHDIMIIGNNNKGNNMERLLKMLAERIQYHNNLCPVQYPIQYEFSAKKLEALKLAIANFKE